MKKYNLELEIKGMLVFIISVIAGMINYVYQIIMGNMLSVTDYGILNTLLSLMMVLSVPASSLSVIALKFSSHYTAFGNEEKISGIYKKLFLIGCICCGATVFCGFFCIKEISNILNIHNYILLFIAFVCAGLAYINQVGNGILQGLKRFVSFSCISILGAVGKIVFSVIFIAMGFGLYGAAGAMAVSTLITIVYPFILLKQYRFNLKTKCISLNDINIKSYFKYVFWTQIFLAFFTNGDIAFIKIFTDTDTVGLYSAAAVICKISYYFANAIASTLLPIVAQEHSKGNSTYKLFLKSVMYGAAVSVGCAAGINIFGEFIIGILYSNEYFAAANLFLPISCFIVMLNLVTIVINYLTATNSLKTLTLSLAASALFILILVLNFKDSLEGIIFSMSAGLAAVFVFNTVLICLAGRKQVYSE